MHYPVILFDLDGTLLNTNELIIASFLHTLEVHCPGKYTREDVMKIMGQPLIDQMNLIDSEQAESMVETYSVHNEAHHDQYVEIFPNVREVLLNLQKMGAKLLIVSNKRRKVVEMGLKLFQLDSLMTEIVCIGDAPRPKPEPDLLLYALDLVKAKPEEAIMVGDSKYDLIAAKRAKMDSVGVNWSYHADDLPNYEPTYLISDMRELISIVRGE